ncbi:MAG: peroxiredoxin [Ignavibacteria bacterium]
MPLQVGDNAPEFILIDTQRRPRRLSEFLGRATVLAFYPAAFTSVCTKEMCTFQNEVASLQALNAHVVGISVDPPFTNKAFAERYNLQFPLLSDFTRYVSILYTGLYVDLGGVAGYTTSKRAVFVLDAQGVVRYAWISDVSKAEPNYEEIKAVLATL